MRVENVETVYLADPNSADPLDVMLVLGARADVDGVRTGWRGVTPKTGNWTADIQAVTKDLVTNILENMT